ncbi:hypothetical protein NM208_g3252 [Fusarium decemcellulare]|uniref:Uncharacterized protein n=1 Tax=Fusarium decemcellulare TaxID=57161 RepID=A0ACC1SPX0_9HYPO|nr:hypothetical protein NM208_g3252 [Fusarium decemcellulare]
MLSVLKAGGTFVMLDPALPEQRLQIMIDQVGASLLISSLENKELSSRLCKITLVVEADGFEDHGATTRKRVPLDPSSVAYIQFTSGSTGVPKGAAISHKSMSSGIHHQLRRLDLGHDTRLYDFSTYSFDMALYNAFFALSSGGCLCVPSESGRKDDLAGSIRSTGANTLLMTPSTAQTISPEDVPAVSKVLFGGEAVHERDAAVWWGQAKVLNMYGPCECTPCSIIGDDLDHPAQAVYIGRGCGANTWVVDPDDHERLVPPGCVGELLLEGPLVSNGYLDDADRNSKTYIEDPTWLLQGHGPEHIGRHARLYKTGDLVRYNDDGSLTFVARKDIQVKIRGQRVELGEVETRIQECLPELIQVAAEVIAPQDSNPMLVAFVLQDHVGAQSSNNVEVYHVPVNAEKEIAKKLPSYMIPSTYLAIREMPKTASGKLNRKQLREIGLTLSPEKLAALRFEQGSKKQPSTDSERLIQRIWGRILGFKNATVIGVEDNFFHLGGDSIAAMKIVRALRELGLELSVADILRFPILQDIAKRVAGSKPEVYETIPPYSLLPEKCDIKSVFRSHHLDPTQTQDAFPCTSLQEGLVSLSAQRSGDYVTQAILELSEQVSIGEFQKAWEAVVEATPLLRTRFIQGDTGLLQVVLDEKVSWKYADNLQTYLEEDRKQPMRLGQAFTRHALVRNTAGRVTSFVLTAHHALHDGWSLGLLMGTLEKTYAGGTLKAIPPFQRFIRYIQNQNIDETSQFWKKALEGCESVPYPALPPSVKKPTANTLVSQAFPNPSSNVGATTSTMIKAAWALVVGYMVNSDDVVLGTTVSGRHAEVSGIDEIPGPTIATVPMRFNLDKTQAIASFLLQYQKLTTDMIPHEQMGLTRIAKLSSDCEQACKFQTLMVIQPEVTGNMKNSLGRLREENAMQWSSSYGLVLEVQLGHHHSTITASFDSRLIDQSAVKSLLRRLEFVLQQLSSASSDSRKTLGDISVLTPADFSTLLNWNQVVPETINSCIHELVHQRAIENPRRPAVCAWNGELTYDELDALSTRLAGHLMRVGVQKETIVPLYFEKSMWTPVAMLAVLKAGGAFLLLDPSLPQARLEVMIKHIDAKIILATENCVQPASDLSENVITVNRTLFSTLNDPVGTGQLSSDPSSAAYVIFTSGSTGTPKGVVITHRNVVSAVTQHSKALEYDESSRVYDFSSYSFGAALNNTFCALTTGACVCVPSDEDRKSNLAASITAFGATDVLLTPSTAETLSPDSVPTLRSLILGGEAVRTQDGNRWLGHVTLRTAYGQSEGTTIATVNPHPATAEQAMSIGKGVGLVTWVVDPANHENLLPPGSIGELMVEGPAVGLGYFKDPKKTAEVFVSDPSWLIKAGRRGRLYKTGDLVRYNDNGSLAYLGRKDSQVKIRGQRIELGDVEYWVRELMLEVDQVAVEVITPKGPKGRPTLAAFIKSAKAEVLPQQDNAAVAKLIYIDVEVEKMLMRQLPSYMVPTAFIAISSLPMTSSGKMNRRELRKIGSDFSADEVRSVQLANNGPIRQPVTEKEHQMQRVWSQVLGVERELIDLNASFFQLGGDSIAAIEVTGAARKLGLEVTVAEVFQHRTLRLVAEMSRYTSADESPVKPFGLVGEETDATSLRHDISQSCLVDPEIIEDAYPCTPLQEGLISLASKRPGDYMMQAVLELAPTVDIAMFRQAWESVARAAAALRTRIVHHQKLGLLQVALNQNIQWHETTGLDDYVKADRQNHMTLSTPLTRFALAKDVTGDIRWFVLSMHHALYDGWSLPIILDMVDEAYAGGDLKDRTSFQPFINYVVQQVNATETSKYWQTELEGCEYAPYPPLPASIDQPISDTVVQHHVSRPKDSYLGVTPSILARAAWAIVTSRVTGTDDVVFGVTVSGRNAPIANIDRMPAPTFATVPFRVQTPAGQKVSDYLEAIQQKATQMIPYEQLGLYRIAKTSSDSQQVCNFQSLLVVQQQTAGSFTESKLGLWQNHDQQEFFNPYALMVEVNLLGNGDLSLKASFDSRVIAGSMVERLLEQFDFVVQQIELTRPRQTLGDISTMTEVDLHTIWSWNQVVPEPAADLCLQELVERQAAVHPEGLAISAWDGDFSYKQLDLLSSHLALQLVEAGLGEGQLIPLCFQKSKWTPISVIAVLKAGGVFVLLDPSLPEERLKAISKQVGSSLIVSSIPEEALSSRLSARVVLVGEQMLHNLSSEKVFKSKRQPVTAPMFAVFTSGSTGTPKGALMSHINFASGLHHQLELLGFNKESRVFDFASYAFDIAVHNIFAAFLLGGCLCIPSEVDRKGNVGKVMAEMRVTIADLTPSVGRLLSPTSLPDLETVIFAGEELTTGDVQRWNNHVRVVNAYGPAECNIVTINRDAKNDGVHIGKGAGINTWVVDPNDSNTLLPPGSPGELLLEGPVVGLGYLNDPAKTASSFIHDPVWLVRGAPGRPGRSGRLYKTGDLVRYDQQGNLSFLGRKDAQVKIRGQRVELGEVEHWVQQCLSDAEQVVGEVITPTGDKGKPILAAFVQRTNNTANLNPDPAVLTITPGMEKSLEQNLPSYMIPSAFFAIMKIPMTPTGKVNRKKLREIGAAFSTQQLAKSDATSTTSKEQPITHAAKRMQFIWCQVLDLEPVQVGLDDSFFRLGGDSITAMKVVGEADKVDVKLSVADIFQHKTLRNVSLHSSEMPVEDQSAIEPFSLLGGNIDVSLISREIADEIGVDGPSSILDVFPCTALQEGLISLGSKRAGNYVAHGTLEISPDIDITAFCHAWEETVRSMDILRTRIVQHERLGLVQVVLDSEPPIAWIKATGLETYRESDRKQFMTIPSPLTRYALVDESGNENGRPRWFVWTIHHALYDGWSMPLIMRAVEETYKGKTLKQGPQFQSFIKYIQQTEESSIQGYWKDTLQNCESVQFPALPHGVDEPKSTSFIHHRIVYPRLSSSSDITISTLIRAAWALVLADTTDSSDVVFGVTVSGRSAPVRRINNLVAPTISTVPVRVQLPPRSVVTISEYLKSLQKKTTDMIPFEQTGLRRISKISPDAKQACSFQNLVVLNPQRDSQKHTSPLGQWCTSDQKEWFGTYALMLEMQLGSDVIEIDASSDSRIIEPWLVEKLLLRLDHVTQQLAMAGPNQTLSDIDSVTPRDLEDIWSWSRHVSRAFNQQMKGYITQAQCQSPTTGLNGWITDPKNPNRLVAPGCVGELLLEGPDIELKYSEEPKALPMRPIQNPDWLKYGSPTHPGRHGAVYRTGCLVRCGQNGEVTLVASDTDIQARLCGQRINLSDIERWVCQCIPDAQDVVAEVVTSDNERNQQTLAVFLHFKGTETIRPFAVRPEALAELATRLPPHSTPSVFLSLGILPLKASGQLNRQQLKDMGASFLAEARAKENDQVAPPKRQPENHIEHQLQKIWARVLDLKPTTVGLDDSFFDLGGDSVAAIKVASAARKAGISITVAGLFRYPTLSEAASQAGSQVAGPVDKIGPFALLGSNMDVKKLIIDLARHIGVRENAIEDAYQCDYISQAVIELDSDCDITRFKQAWENTVQMTQILRTRIVHSESTGLVQVVLNENICWNELPQPLEEYLQLDRDTSMDLGQPLTRYALIQGDSDKPKYFVWTIHHALYDGWSMRLVFDVVNRTFRGEQAMREWPQFQQFIKYVDSQDDEVNARYWRESLEGFDSAAYPEIPTSVMEQPVPNSSAEHSFTYSRAKNSGIMTATLVRAAWALVAGRMSSSSDVVFGANLSGRNAPVGGIHDMPAPTITTVPIRMDTSGRQTVSSYLANAQIQATTMIPFEQYGLQRIAKLSPDAQKATQFQTLLVIQPQGDEQLQIDKSMGKFYEDCNQTRWFNTQALLIQVTLRKGQITASASFDSNVIPSWLAARLLQRLEHVMRQLDSAKPGTTISQIDMVLREDLNDIWGWNATVPEKIEKSVHDLLRQRALQRPQACAISAWDGELTYQQLDTLASHAAARLNSSGIGSGLILLCFEKSMWAYVAMVAALKAGFGFVCLDPSLPETRLQGIVRQVNASALMCSAAQKTLSSRLYDKTILQIDRRLLKQPPSQRPDPHPRANPSSVMYVVFTSGTTGTPKGIAISHENFASSLVHQEAGWGLTTKTRMYEFSSYGFDMSYAAVFATLYAGGCVCVPSDEDRKDVICASMRAFEANSVILTPATSRLLSPTEVPELKTIIFGGETVRVQDLQPWWGTARVVNGYGPSECTPFSTINVDAEFLEAATSIGKGVGAATWIVDPDDHNVLLPLGCTGELLIEGPIVGCGYWNDPQKTSASFIKDPTWLLRGVPDTQDGVGYPGRRGRLYKTGDLVRFDQYGNITHVARKDFQVKIRGQRVELSEVEHRVKECIPESDQVAAEVITLQGSDGRPSLAAFIVMDSRPKTEQAAIYPVSAEVEKTLAIHLPVYMRPSIFFVLGQMPVSASDKVDRKALRTIGASFSVQEQTLQTGPKRQPVTETERELHAIWSRVLKLDPSAIGLDDSLFQLGGDSISAMMVAQEARKIGIKLGASDIFRHPKLWDIASLSFQKVDRQAELFEPFALVDSDKESLLHSISTRYGLDENTIEDVYPCTPLQEGFISLTSKRPGAYVMQNSINLSDISVNRFRQAWENVVATLPILRTMIIHHPNLGLLQLVSNKVGKWSEATNLDAYVKADRAESMDIGRPLSRHAIVQDPSRGNIFVWTIHHAIYDGWTMRLMIQALESALRNEAFVKWPPYQPFINYIRDQDGQAQAQYWKETFSGYEGSPFPALPPGIEQPVTDSVIEHQLPNPKSHSLHMGITVSTLIRAAWALVVSNTSLSDDTVFGVTLSGRNAPISGIDNMPAPTIATVPVRVNTATTQKVTAYLESVQDMATEMMPFEHTGLHRISRISPECQQACTFQTLLIVHPQGTSEMEPTFGSWLETAQDDYFNTYVIMLELYLANNSITAKASFDSRVIAPWMVQNLLKRLESVLVQLSNAKADSTIKEITAMTPKDLDWIWQRNGKLPATVERCVHDVVQDIVKMRPTAQAVYAWDGMLTYAELDKLTGSLSAYLIEYGVQPGQLIPVLFEKSMWTPVVMLAILKAEAAFVLLDTSLPEERLRVISRQVGSDLIVTSIKNKTMGASLAQHVIEVGPNIIDITLRPRTHSLPRPTQLAHSPMFVIFTSGSTGTPKGVMLSHANFCSQIEHQAEILAYRQDSRVFDYAAYSFDAAVHNVFTTWAVGGCLCIPSDDDRKGDITQVMADMLVTMADLTPTVARLLEPSALPLLKTLTFSGEAVSVDDAKRWWGHADVVNAYGPAEAGISTIKHDCQSPGDAVSIGFGAGLTTWIVHPDDSDTLLPPGVVGELLLEGPLVGQGYLNDPNKTAASFINNPSWLLQGTRDIRGRRSRLYKTGDLVQYNQDGSLMYLGRKDTQVKIRGQRIELGEIEHCITKSIPNVGQVVVEAIKPQDGKGKTILAAFITEDSKGNEAESDDDSINLKNMNPAVMEILKSQLTVTMVPSVFFSMKKLPQTATGKTNRKHLRELGARYSVQQLAENKSASVPKVQPTTPEQLQMQTIWATVLELDCSTIGLDDSFLQLGGDSIAAMRVAGEARQIGLQLSVADIFRTPKLRDLIRRVSLAPKAFSDAIKPIPHSEPVEQSFAQGRLWFLEQLYPGLTWYLMPFAIRFQGPLQLDALEKALNTIESRHDTLRSTFLTRNGAYFQQVHPFVPKKLPIIDISSGGEESLTQSLKKDQTVTFDLTREAGWRVTVYKLGEEHHVLSVVLHHINSDGWSIGVFRKELAQLYSAALRGKDPATQIQPLPVQYRDYSAWQKQRLDNGEFQRQLDYWTDKLQTSRPVEFLADKPRPKTLSGKADVHEFRFEGDMFNRIQSFCNKYAVTPFVVLLAAFRATHYRMTGVEDATVGTANANRDRWELKNMIGFFVNLQCLRITVEDDSFESLVRQVQQTTAESFDNQDIPFEQIVAKLNRERDLSRHPLAQVAFALHARGTSGAINLEGVESEMLGLIPTTRFDLEFHFFEEENALQGDVIYSTDLYTPEMVANMLDVFNVVLEGGLDEPQSKIASLPLLMTEGFEALNSMGLLEIDQTDYPRDSTIIDIFQQQVTANPRKVAVKDSTSQITFAVLDQKSDSVARWLTTKGFSAETVVPVIAKRSVETIVAFLGILKANFAYLPLAPNTPGERLKGILSSIKGPTVILLGNNVRSPDFENMESTSIDSISESKAKWSLFQRLCPIKGPSASSLAYVLYTSGSTGRPKGVMLEHRGVLRLVLQNNYTRYLTRHGAVAHMLNIIFDASMLEIYSALLNGLTLVCLDHEVILDSIALQKTFLQEGIGYAVFTPAHLKQVLADSPTIISQLDTIVVGGDRFDPDDAIRAQRAIKGQVINAYGPTENTVISTLYPVNEADLWANGLPIGRALSNSGAYIMDSELHLQPLGVIGELVVTGDGLARGYTESQRNIDRFVTVDINGQELRAYRTGDLARFRPTDGQIEFFGRMDVQVKIRGHRVELGEIEQVLLGHDSVTDAVALIHQEDSQEPQLYAFVTFQNIKTEEIAEVDELDGVNDEDGDDEDDEETGHIQVWKGLFDGDKYVGIDDGKALGRDFMGWTSMYDGALIDKEEMNEWLDETIATINLSLGDGHVLELGTGSGMILFNLIEGLSSYIGIDPAERAVDYVNKAAKSIPSLADKVRVYKGTADKLDDLPGLITPNIVICNSVAQYFPSQGYLFKVIEELVQREGIETLFFGDMRSQAMYREFCVTKVLSMSGDSITQADLRQRIADIGRAEVELLVDPGFFTALKSRLPDFVDHVEILPKNMVATNELSCYRYAAVIHLKTQPSRRQQVHSIERHQWVDFTDQALSRSTLVQRLQSSLQETLPISNIPYNKTIYERFVVEHLSKAIDDGSSDKEDWLSTLRAAAQNCPSLSAHELKQIAEQTGYRVEISWARQFSLHGGLDAVFHRIEPELGGTRVLFQFPNDHEGRPLRTMSSNPLLQQARQRVKVDLEARLRDHLPSYMIPKAITILDEMPVNTSGKVDRKVLAETLRTRTAPVRGEVREPNNKTEEQLQKIWARVLGISSDGIGLDDSFFQLGGDSITAMKVVSEARKLGINLAVSDVFRSDSLEELALQPLQHAGELDQDEEPVVLVNEETQTALLQDLDALDFGIRSDQVTDILPLTSMQARYITEGSTNGQFANYFFLDFGLDLDIGRLKSSIHHVLQAIPILRAAFVQIKGKYWQVVPRMFDVPWLERDVERPLTEASLNFCRADSKTISFVKPPALFTLLKNKTEGLRLVIRMSHAQYDGASFPCALRALIDGYFGRPMAIGPDYSVFLAYAARRRPESITYWKDLLQGSSLTTIQPHISTGDQGLEPKPVAVCAAVTLPSLPGKTTTATLASAAWALLVAHLTRAQDVVYGHVVTGRNGRISGMDELVGPTLNVAPVRATLSATQTPRELLRHLQKQFSSMGDADSLGYDDIMENCTSWPAGTQFESIIHHANIDEHPYFDFGQDKIKLEFFQNTELVPQHIMVASYPLGDRLQFNVLANTHIMSHRVGETLAKGLCTIVSKMGAAPDEPLFKWLDELRLDL